MGNYDKLLRTDDNHNGRSGIGRHDMYYILMVDMDTNVDSELHPVGFT